MQLTTGGKQVLQPNYGDADGLKVITVIEYGAKLYVKPAPTFEIVVIETSWAPDPARAALSCGIPYVHTVAVLAGPKPLKFKAPTNCNEGVLLITKTEIFPSGCFTA